MSGGGKRKSERERERRSSFAAPFASLSRGIQVGGIYVVEMPIQKKWERTLERRRALFESHAGVLIRQGENVARRSVGSHAASVDPAPELRLCSSFSDCEIFSLKKLGKEQVSAPAPKLRSGQVI